MTGPLLKAAGQWQAAEFPLVWTLEGQEGPLLPQLLWSLADGSFH